MVWVFVVMSIGWFLRSLHSSPKHGHQIAEASQLLPVATYFTSVRDQGSDESFMRQISIECPGVDAEEITIVGLPNGVRVKISGTAFQQDFHYDHNVDGLLELRHDECSYQNGLLLLVLRRAPLQQMTFQKSQPARLCCPSNEVSNPATHNGEAESSNAETAGERTSTIDSFQMIYPQHDQGADGSTREHCGDLCHSSTFNLPLA